MHGTLRLVTLFALWSYDHWVDACETGSDGSAGTIARPSHHGLFLAASFDRPPSQSDLAARLADAKRGMAARDGHAELRSYALVGEGGWNLLTAGRDAWFRAGPIAGPCGVIREYPEPEDAEEALLAASSGRPANRPAIHEPGARC